MAERPAGDRVSGSAAPALLDVQDLRVEFPTRHGRLVAVDDVSFSIARGEMLGVVGESGAGKSITGNAIIRLVEPPGEIARGTVSLAGERIDNLPAEALRRVRGRRIGMVFQDPLTSLNPLYTVGEQLVETIRTHRRFSRQAARERAIELLHEVGLPAPEARIDAYPHQFSGGMRQRVVIALALCCDPELIIADEPTTALDVSVQAQILALLKRLCVQRGTGVMLITHDMGVIAETVDRVMVMYAGRVVERGPVEAVVQAPSHPYSAGLMGAIPKLEAPAERLVQIPGTMPRLSDIPAGCAFHPRCPHAFARCHSERPEPMPAGESVAACWLYARHGDAGAGPAAVRGTAAAMAPATPGGKRVGRDGEAFVVAEGLARQFDVSKPFLNRVFEGGHKQILRAVDGIDFAIPRGQTFALVGESGCGKSTVARLLVGLDRPSRGRMAFGDHDITHLAELSGRRAAPLRRDLQMIFQDPYASLNPLWKVEAIVAEPLRVLGLVKDRREAGRRVAALLEQVGLSAADGAKYPHEFSGGQRQRISIARALANDPSFIVCDEPTSALDVSVQAQILNLMQDLQRQRGLTYLFISHDMAVVQHMADTVGVMYLGRLVEVGPKESLFAAPRHPYTQMLLQAVPGLDKRHRRTSGVQGEVPNPVAPPSGCPFHPRCPHANERCRQEVPQLRSTRTGDRVACHGVEEGRLDAEAAKSFAPAAPAEG